MYNRRRVRWTIYYVIMVCFIWSCTSERSFQVKNVPDVKDAAENKETIKSSQRPIEEQDIASHMEASFIQQDTRRNTPPKITQVCFIPDVFRPGDTLGVHASGSDVNGDRVMFRYKWFINDRFSGSSKHLNEPIKRGDHLTVHVTPYDGNEEGRPVTLERDIINLPPNIRTTQELDFDGGTYIYQIIAEDPDGDTLKYSLSAAPKGMTISHDSGLIIWNVPEEYEGTQNVSVLVEDGHGGRAQYDLNITIKLEEISS